MQQLATLLKYSIVKLQTRVLSWSKIDVLTQLKYYGPYSENLLKFVRNCLPHRFIESFYKLASCLKIPFSKRLELFSGFQVQPVNQWVRPNMNFTLSTFNPYTYDIDNVPRPIQLQNKNIIPQIQLGEIISQRAYSFSPKTYLRFSKRLC